MSKPLKLNLGSNEVRFDGFLNVDIDAKALPDYVCDASNLDSICEDGSVEEIVAFDVIEHFDRFKYKDALLNWKKKLIPGKGTLHLRTNDWDRVIKMYVSRQYFGQDNPMDFTLLVWHLMCEHEQNGMGHKWGFNQVYIEQALKEAGFNQIRFATEEELSSAIYPYASRPDHTNLFVTARVF